MKGITYRKSRYLTLSAVIHTPMPMLAANAMTAKNGRNRTCQPGANRYQIIRPMRMTKPIRKSTNATMTAAVGTMRRGKYTLPMRLALLIRLLEASATAVAKKLHGNMPAKTIKAYGAVPSDGSWANFPNTTVNTTIVRNGRILD